MSVSIPSGTLSVFQVGPNVLAVENVAQASKVTTDDVTHTLANGWQVLVGVISSSQIKVDGGYDVNANYHATPPNIRPGAVLTSVTCSPDGVKLYVNQYLVVEFNWKGGPKAGAVRWDATLQSTGAAMTYPTT